MSVQAAPTSDAVSEVLQSLSVRSSVFCLSDMRAPWAFRVDGSDVAKFHLVLTGSAQVTLQGHTPLEVSTGDLVVLPHGQAHTIADAPGSRVVALERIIQDQAPADASHIRYGGSGALTRLLCGGFSVAATHAALNVLPDILHVRTKRVPVASWIEPILAMLKSEAADGQLGSSAIVTKIADVFLTQALRAWLVDAQGSGVLFTGQVRDQPIAEAVRAIQSRPAEPWTVDRLAAQVGLARTALGVRFRELVGESPIRYLTKVRLGQAAAYLSTSQLTIYEVMRLTGYRDVAAFSKAFKRQFGQSPGVYRRMAMQAPDISIA
jgi:AraC-like DNA-binding protein